MPDWAKKIFSRGMIAAGNVTEERELNQICTMAVSNLRNYIDKSDRVHQKFENELNQGKQLKNHIDEKNLYPLCDEILKKDNSKTKEECFKFLRLTLEKNFNNHHFYGQGWCTIPIPKDYKFKSILNQDNDINNFSKIWLHG